MIMQPWSGELLPWKGKPYLPHEKRCCAQVLWDPETAQETNAPK
jgi:hypothetical protein